MVPIAERLHEVASLPSVAASTRMETILAAGVEIEPGRVLGGARMAVGAPADDDLRGGFGRVRVIAAVRVT